MSVNEVGAGHATLPQTSANEVHMTHLWRSTYRAILVGGYKTNIRHGVLHSLREQSACDVLQHLALLIPCNAHP